MGVYVPLIIRVISVCSSVVTTSTTSTHVRVHAIVLVTDLTLAEPALAIHLVLPLMVLLTFLKLPLVTFQLPLTSLKITLTTLQLLHHPVTILAIMVIYPAIITHVRAVRTTGASSTASSIIDLIIIFLLAIA
jgi:hypothetical protein